MVKEIKYLNEKLYYCEVCKLIYKEKEWAEKCEEWCRRHHSCNIEMTGHTIKLQEK